MRCRDDCALFDLFVGCLTIQDVYRGLADALEMKCTHARSFMPPTDARRHRSAVARVVFMAQDRPDLDVVACILAKKMAHPKSGDEWLVEESMSVHQGQATIYSNL